MMGRSQFRNLATFSRFQRDGLRISRLVAGFADEARRAPIDTRMMPIPSNAVRRSESAAAPEAPAMLVVTVELQNSPSLTFRRKTFGIT